jgi:hypothetical protein
MNSPILETLVLGESELGYAVLGSEEEPDLLEHILKIISNDSFPRPGSRDDLLPGPRRQLRDAMILLAHVREHREIFVTDDKKAFVRHGRREKLELLLSTSIMTSKEFLSFLATSF